TIPSPLTATTVFVTTTTTTTVYPLSPFVYHTDVVHSPRSSDSFAQHLTLPAGRCSGFGSVGRLLTFSRVFSVVSVSLSTLGTSQCPLNVPGWIPKSVDLSTPPLVPPIFDNALSASSSYSAGTSVSIFALSCMLC